MSASKTISGVLRHATVLLAAALAGCASPDARQVRLVFANDPAAVRALCGPSFLEPYGCAKIIVSPAEAACTLVVPRPKSFDDKPALLVLGHELWHCFHGEVHD